MCFLFSLHTQVVRWTFLRSAAPSWRPPSLQRRWCTEAPSSIRDPWQEDPWCLPLLPPPAPPPLPPASPLSVQWPSPAPAPPTRRPCTTAYLRPARVTFLQPAVPRPQTTSLPSGRVTVVDELHCFTNILRPYCLFIQEIKSDCVGATNMWYGEYDQKPMQWLYSNDIFISFYVKTAHVRWWILLLS